MGTPADYLPESISHDAINELLISFNLHPAIDIRQVAVTAQYHGVYFITVPPNNKAIHNELVLRVSGNHLPYIKTENEVGVMAWVAKNTKIPIPALVGYDSTPNNPTGHEYTLMSRVPGETICNIYSSLSPDEICQILDQLIDMLTELHAHDFSAIGGLYLDRNGEIQVGRIVDETYWQVPDIEILWPQGETVDSLNLGGPYATYTELVAGQVNTYIRLINLHDKLEFMRDAIPHLERFAAAVGSNREYAPELNKVKLRLAHKDLHFANMLYDRSSNRITGILDWEFSGVVPFTQWNPRRAFLWNGRDDADSVDEKQRVLRLFEERCERKGRRDTAGCHVLVAATGKHAEGR
ncbi:hypothetical protein DL771_002701 [Monosporascus sp. 5C6A]|nr:hypothetical protein DL771_002701 [Monosporascus sp. 5C6A]